MSKKTKGKKWDGKSRVSTDLYRKRWDEIFKKRVMEGKDPFKKPVVKNEVKVKNLKKLLKEIEDRNGF